MWGDNRDCRIFKRAKTYQNSGRYRNYAVPQLCIFSENNAIIQVSCGTTHSLVLTSEGKVFAAGSNEFGQLGVKDYKIMLVNNQDSKCEGFSIAQIDYFEKYS